MAETMQAPGGKLSAVGSQGQLAVECNALATLDEISRFAPAAEAQPFQPEQGEETEAVIEFGEVNVRWFVVCPAPQAFPAGFG
ncbi:hypothetical protein D9M71_830100 [compost metagenome]